MYKKMKTKTMKVILLDEKNEALIGINLDSFRELITNTVSIERKGCIHEFTINDEYVKLSDFKNLKTIGILIAFTKFLKDKGINVEKELEEAIKELDNE